MSEKLPTVHLDHAILHILNFTTQLYMLSEEELDLTSDRIQGYIRNLLFRSEEDARLKAVRFDEGSEAARALEDHREGKIAFIDLSDALSKRFIDVFTAHPDLRSFDLLISEYHSGERSFLALFVLESVHAFSHQVGTGEKGIRNEIVEHQEILPSPTHKPKCYCLIDLTTMSVRYVDELRTSADPRPQILQKVLSCGETRSSEENVKILKKVAVKVAESSEEEPSVVLSRMKEALQRSVYEKESFSPVSLAEDIFEEESSRKDFLERVRENSLPEEVEVPMQAVNRMAARQKIRTDNGIEISAPSEYFSDPNYVEIRHNPDGSINILLKQVGEIRSRL